jgi:uncharacterized protein involved in type VI secretion and phage assembly
MAQDLNKVETTLLVSGAKTHFVSLYLSQAMNSHHHFEIEVDFEEMDRKWMESAANLIGLIGETVNITMKHKQTGEENLFEGIITNVTLSGYHGQQNAVIITGKSTTIKLDGKDTMDSFMDKTLQQIIDEAVGNSGNGGSVTSKPEFGGKLDYICQYNETCFEFINRMSWLFGEWFFNNGKETFFGKPSGGDVVDITYDIEMTSFNLSANLAPPKYNRYYYLHHDDKEVDEDAPDSVPGVQGYLQKSLGMSKKVYTSDADIPLDPIVTTKKELEDLLKVEKTRSVGNMLIMSGNSQTCKIKVGEKIKIKFPTTMEVGKKEVDIFTVIEVTHNVDQEGHYSNSFKGILSELNNIPMTPCPAPIATSQLAWVKSNADDKKLGRVKVQTQWQKKSNKTTNWIRVQTPDAGPNPHAEKYKDIVPQNRGLVTIPEEGDIVMLGFEYGDPNRPFVAGSIFSERASKGGDDDNKKKSYTTRVDSSITFDDSKGSITIKDQKGSDSTMVFDGKTNITVTADTSITLTSGSASIKLESADDGIITVRAKTINVYAGETYTLDSGKVIRLTSNDTFDADAITSSTMNSSGETTVSSIAKTIVTSMGEVAVDGAIVKLN